MNRATDHCDGSVFFTANDFYDNPLNAIDSMKQDLYRYPALWPVMPWKDDSAPAEPRNAVYAVEGDGSKTIIWDAPAYSDPADSGYAYVVYRAPYPLDDISTMNTAQVVLIDKDNEFSDNVEGSYYYGITALDRNKLESGVADIDYPFVHPQYPVYAEDSAPKDLLLKWNLKEGASEYDLQLSVSNDFSSPLGEYTVSDTSKDLALDYQSDYFWRVKANNTSFWSPIWKFTTQLPPQVDVYTPMAYREGIELSPTLSWQPFEDASTYEVQVSTNSAMTNLIVNEASVTDTNWQVNGLDYATYYYWRLRSDKYDRWTDIMPFKTREEYVDPLWERTVFSERYPAFGDSTLEAGGLALGSYQDNKVLLILQSNEGRVQVNAVNALNGDDIAFDLNLSGVSGGKHILRDIEFSEDGVIYAANCANIGDDFKVYQWIDPAAAPQIVYQADNVAYRLGDHIRVTGRHDDGSVKLYAPGAKSDKLLRLTWDSVGGEFLAKQMTLERGNNSNPGIAVRASNGELYVTSDDYYVRHFTALGKNINWMKDNLTMPKNANAIETFYYNGKTYLAGYVADTESAHIIDVTDGVRVALKAGSTYRMGMNKNELLLGDIEVLDNEDGTFSVFVLGNQNGVSAYTFDATSAMVGIADAELPVNFELGRNYPNPFNPTTSIPFNLSMDSDVEISVFDINGKYIATLFAGFKPAGYHEVKFNASQLSSGQYFYRMTAGDVSVTRKMILLK